MDAWKMVNDGRSDIVMPERFIYTQTIITSHY